jgi:hypothetical protein
MGRKSETPLVERIRFHFEEQIIADRLKLRQRLVEEEIAREMSVSRSQSSGRSRGTRYSSTRRTLRRGASGRAGPRLGTTAMTMRGMDEADFRTVGTAPPTILGFGPDRRLDRGRQRGMAMLAEEHPIPCGFVSTRSHSASGGAAHVQ